MWLTLSRSANRWRRESLKLPPIPVSGPYNILYQEKAPFIYGYSQHVVPRTADMPDWHHVTGYWFLETGDDWSPPADLVKFLSQGPRPIYIGFGSMSGQTARKQAQMAIDSVHAANQRAILVGGWAEAHDLNIPENIFASEYIPHDWLFPQMAAVVHHGGAGTTAAGLRAGVPSVIIPFMGDQHFWGKRVFELGAGPEPITRKKLTVDQLADRITRAVVDQSFIQNASILGKKIRGENGLKKAVELIMHYLGSSSKLI